MSKFASLFSLAGACLVALAPAASAQQAEPSASPDGSAPAGDLAPNDTEILANQGATFAAKDRIATFTGEVRVHDPRFALACDKLTVYLAKGALPEGGAPTPAPTATPAPIKGDAKDAGRPGGGGIDHAFAEGHVTIVQKRAPTKAGEEEKTSVGRAETVEYDNKSGDLTLRGMPKVEQNGDYHEALSRSTYMVLHRDNSLDTYGPSRTHIIQRSKDANTPGGKPATKSGKATPGTNRRPTATNATQG